MTFVTFETSGQLRYIGGFKYQVVENFWIKLNLKNYSVNWRDLVILEPDGTLHINYGFGSDCGSGPTIDTKSTIRASFVHDALYLLLRMGCIGEKSRKYADEVLRDLGIFDGMWRWRAWAWFWAVQKFATGSARRQERREKLAP